MTVLDSLDFCAFVQAVLEDASKTNTKEGAVIDEHEFYIQRVGFSTAHLLSWFKQLHLASEYLSHFDYSKKVEASRASHAVYNVENYLIRLNSVYDRSLHIVNAVFHLCVNEEHVSHTAIVTNYRVQHREIVVRRLKKLRKYLAAYAQERHTLVHRHSLLDVKLRRLELFYLHNLEHLGWSKEEIKDFKIFRAGYLRDFVAEKKQELARINIGLADVLLELFESLHAEYNSQRESFRLRGL
jgi:hypothetical protein